jgi:hypothetical protein
LVFFMIWKIQLKSQIPLSQARLLLIEIPVTHGSQTGWSFASGWLQHHDLCPTLSCCEWLFTMSCSSSHTLRQMVINCWFQHQYLVIKSADWKKQPLWEHMGNAVANTDSNLRFRDEKSVGLFL